MIEPHQPLSIPNHPQDAAEQAKLRSLIRRLLFVVLVASTALLTFIASAAQKFEAVESQVAKLDAAKSLSDPELVALSTKVAFVLAAVISGVVLAVYLSLCALVDSKVLPGLRKRIPVLGQIGPSFVVGVLGTLPVAVAAMAFQLTSPKDSPVVICYLMALTTAAALIFLFGRTTRTPRSRQALVVVILAVVAALSLVV